MTQEPLPPLTDYAILLQRLAAHLQVAAGLLHDIAEYNPEPAKFRSAIAAIAAQFSFMDSSSDPAHSPDVQRALEAARARTTVSILSNFDEQIKEFHKPPTASAIIPPNCSECGGKMGVVGWSTDENGVNILWGCPKTAFHPNRIISTITPSSKEMPRPMTKTEHDRFGDDGWSAYPFIG